MRCLTSPLWLGLRKLLHVTFGVTIQKVWGLTSSGSSSLWGFLPQSGAEMEPWCLPSTHASSSCGLHLFSKQTFLLLNLLTQVQFNAISGMGISLRVDSFSSREHRKTHINSWLIMPFLTSRYPFDKFSYRQSWILTIKIFLWILFSLLWSTFNLCTWVL